jgi:hypothetical protein
MTKKKVLQDHKRQGKKFIPPFTHMLGQMREVSWVKTVLPELLWIALIQDHHGLREGVELITVLARAARKCSGSKTLRIFGTISSFAELNDDEKASLRGALATSGALFRVQKAILPLVAFYPECPLKILFLIAPYTADQSKENLEKLKSLIEYLYDKTSKNSTMVQATMIWLAFDSGSLKVAEGLILSNFPEIENYPHSELSKKVAASIRSAINIFFSNNLYSEHSGWPDYFWNRGLEIDRCYFEDGPDG